MSDEVKTHTNYMRQSEVIVTYLEIGMETLVRMPKQQFLMQVKTRSQELVNQMVEEAERLWKEAHPGDPILEGIVTIAKALEDKDEHS